MTPEMQKKNIQIITNTLLSNQCTQRENGDLLKHIKIMKAVPTRFGLQGNHHQVATTSN